MLLEQVGEPLENLYVNQGKPIKKKVQEQIFQSHKTNIEHGMAKKQSIHVLPEKFGRGYWSVLKIIDGTTNKSATSNPYDQQEIAVFGLESD